MSTMLRYSESGNIIPGFKFDELSLVPGARLLLNLSTERRIKGSDAIIVSVAFEDPNIGEGEPVQVMAVQMEEVLELDQKQWLKVFSLYDSVDFLSFIKADVGDFKNPFDHFTDMIAQAVIPLSNVRLSWTPHGKRGGTVVVELSIAGDHFQGEVDFHSVAKFVTLDV